jgi:outer membrane protein assembly factor BamB
MGACSCTASEDPIQRDPLVFARLKTAAKPESNRPWPQFCGPDRENISADTGLLTEWPQDGPPLAWTARGVGAGYSSVSVADGVLFTMGSDGRDEFVICLSAEDGSILWKKANGKARGDGMGDGPRSTPTIDGDRVYALGANGDLSCRQIDSGEVVWQVNILKEFDSNNIGWGISESVLIDGDRLICTPGGQEATLAALDKTTGKTLWKASVPGGGPAAYSSPIVVEAGGVRQYVTFIHQGVVGVRADDGKFLWMDRNSANGTANCANILFGADHVFSSSGYGTGGALVKLTSSEGETSAELVYHTNDLKVHHGGMVLLDGYVYGSDEGVLTCMDFLTGDIQWQNRSVGKGALTYADGHLYLRSESGPVALVQATPDEYIEKGRFNQPDRSGNASWPYPVVAGGRLYLRDQELLLAYDLKARP